MPGEPAVNARPAMSVVVARTGTANIASILAGLRRAGAAVTVADEPSALREADAAVLPGVGSFGAAMRRLDALGFISPLRDRIDRGEPTLAICLGMQMLFAGSEESPDARGLAVVPGEAKRFTSVPRVPHMGWNQVVPEPACELLTPGYAYFANSYHIIEAPRGWAVARTAYGREFIAAIERGPVLACQFHPELSGAWGQALLGRWLARARQSATSDRSRSSC